MMEEMETDFGFLGQPALGLLLYTGVKRNPAPRCLGEKEEIR